MIGEQDKNISKVNTITLNLNDDIKIEISPLTLVNEILYTICKDKTRLYFLSRLNMVYNHSTGKLEVDQEWGELIKTEILNE